MIRLKRPYYKPMNWCPKLIAKNLESIVRRMHKHTWSLLIKKKRHFDRWCASKKVSTFDTLRQLMLVEEFKRCVNDDIKTHLEENKADKLSEVANLADQYALTHKFGKVGQTQNKGQFSRPNKKYGNSTGTAGNSGSQSGSISPTNSGKKQPDASRQKNDQVSANKAAFKDIICGFCQKKGHTMANCFKLAKLKETETASNALANVENSSEVVVTQRPNSNDKIKEEYLPFVSEGFISLDGNSAHPPVKIKILRDTGATQSLLLDGVLPLSDSTSTGANVLIQGVECGFISVPLHKINLKSDLVSGSVIVGVRPTLPVKGVSLLLGNDLAGGKVVANAILTDKPCDYNNKRNFQIYSLPVLSLELCHKSSPWMIIINIHPPKVRIQFPKVEQVGNHVRMIILNIHSLKMRV
ncbi:hypothetical protein HOLleu_23154 [Holothuria leucospilota]|uniref:Peptidase A2 domain-containing protein n=1 Tax=Holothuria leucospilota TaxID=206669 RepID=A0A9Q1BUE1_HOLLE|nr:hypothetical protein HOLleu_23154 [Holothuria leucospilota]